MVNQKNRLHRFIRLNVSAPIGPERGRTLPRSRRATVITGTTSVASPLALRLSAIRPTPFD